MENCFLVLSQTHLSQHWTDLRESKTPRPLCSSFQHTRRQTQTCAVCAFSVRHADPLLCSRESGDTCKPYGGCRGGGPISVVGADSELPTAGFLLAQDFFSLLPSLSSELLSSLRGGSCTSTTHGAERGPFPLSRQLTGQGVLTT